jgi:RimJ/RimL family protein N-acetyltransferase
MKVLNRRTIRDRQLNPMDDNDHEDMMPFEPVVIQTQRLTLRLLTDADIPALFEIFSHPEVMRYWSSPPMTEPAQARQMLVRNQEAYRSQSALPLGIERHADNLLVGTCTLYNFHIASRRAELGYALGRPFWGAGTMHEALEAFIAYAFETLDLNRLEADIDPRNLSSARTLDRLGFQMEGHLRERWIVSGEVSDTWLYGLLRRNWLEQHPAA